MGGPIIPVTKRLIMLRRRLNLGPLQAWSLKISKLQRLVKIFTILGKNPNYRSKQRQMIQVIILERERFLFPLVYIRHTKKLRGFFSSLAILLPLVSSILTGQCWTPILVLNMTRWLTNMLSVFLGRAPTQVSTVASQQESHVCLAAPSLLFHSLAL